MKNKKLILVLVIMLVIGFASISTTLVLNGAIGISSKKDDFKVIFTKAVINGNNEAKATISEDKKSITFETDKLSIVGDSAELLYKVKNASTQYDANVTINCTNENEEYLKVISEFAGKTLPLTESEFMEAQEEKTGSIRAELKKSYVGEDKSISITCKIEAKGGERDTIVEDTTCEYPNGTKWEFNYTGSGQEFIVPCRGYYKVELYGAQGGNYNYIQNHTGGLGGRTSGVIKMNKSEKYALFIGGQGSVRSGGYNGGGSGGSYATSDGEMWNYAGGGGATDIRYFGDSDIDYAVNSRLGLNSRIMVAGGGGGASYYTNGASGGSLIIPSTNNYYQGSSSSNGGGGGGGYFGGAAGSKDNGGGGGSSFISGYYKNVSVKSSDDSTLSDTSIHYSNKYFLDALHEEGKNTGNGKVVITLIGEEYTQSKTTTFDFMYNNSYYLFEVPYNGKYQVELYGAQGGDYGSSHAGGLGGYTSGVIDMKIGEKYVLFIGTKGYITGGGYNGGGNGGSYTHSTGNWKYAGGGGSTDIRYFGDASIDTIVNSQLGINSRIMVAGGGGGGSYYSNGSAGGYVSPLTSSFYRGLASSKGGGGGGGYFGGTAGSSDQGGGGGSSFISGHNGCNAIGASSTSFNIIYTGQPNHYSGYVFTNTQMITGNAVMPSHDGLSTMTGNSGNGYAKITYLE